MSTNTSQPAISAHHLGKLYRLQQGAPGSKTFRDMLTEMAQAFEHYVIGDCLSARTAEEAVYEGLKAGMAV